jgi:hypothetical protein
LSLAPLSPKLAKVESVTFYQRRRGSEYERTFFRIFGYCQSLFLSEKKRKIAFSFAFRSLIRTFAAELDKTLYGL